LTADTAPVKIAKLDTVCAGPECMKLITRGTYIVKAPGGGWKHQNCDKPVRAPRIIR
jgi:hypothetical protein